MKTQLLSVAVLAAARSYGQSVVVPFGSSNIDGNTYSFAGPAITQPQTVRYQQVYGASEFAFLKNSGGGWLTIIHFRGDATNGTQAGVDMPSVQIDLSTTQRGPDGLSATFSDNIGPDDTAVFSGSIQTGLIGGIDKGRKCLSSKYGRIRSCFSTIRWKATFCWTSEFFKEAPIPI